MVYGGNRSHEHSGSRNAPVWEKSKDPWLQLSAYRATVTRKESSGKEDEVQLKESEEVVDDSNDAEDINVDDRQMQQQYM